MNKKRIICWAVSAAWVIVLAGCSGNENNRGEVDRAIGQNETYRSMTLWSDVAKQMFADVLDLLRSTYDGLTSSDQLADLLFEAERQKAPIKLKAQIGVPKEVMESLTEKLRDKLEKDFSLILQSRLDEYQQDKHVFRRRIDIDLFRWTLDQV